MTTTPEIPIHDFLANIPLLRNASAEEIERMAAGTRRVYAQKGEVLFQNFTDATVAMIERMIAWDGVSWDG